MRTFDALRHCSCIWDVTSDRYGNRVVERTYASRTITRTPVKIEFAESDLVHFEGRALRFQNINGEDILLYPGMVVMPRADGAFALVDLRDVRLTFDPIQFVEEEAVPLDAQVAGQTWAKVNKNGTPDLRFKGNYNIPICLYARIVLTSAGGIEEEYQFSNAKLAASFADAFTNYQRALVTGAGPRPAT